MGGRYLNFAVTFVLLFLTIYILFIGRGLLLPLVIALVFWYIIIRLTALYQHIPFKNRRLPYWLSLIIAIITAGVVLYLFFILLEHSISSIIAEAPRYQRKLQSLLDWLNQFFGGKFDIGKWMGQIDLSQLFSRIALIASTTASNFILILIYLLFLLLEHSTFQPKLKAMCKNPEQYKKASILLNKIDTDINNYLKIKTANNIIAALLSYFLLLSFGIDYAEFWGVFIFLLHYIPFIGPIVAVVLVLLAASIQVTTLIPFIVLGVVLITIQFAVGNFLEPRWMGTRLNLSPIVILLSLAFWGAIWGVIGMFLCVPIMVIINIILSKFPKTRPIAVMLSATGNVNSD